MTNSTYRERADSAYRQYGPVVYRRCMRLLRDPDSAKDATQDVFIKLLRDLDKLEDSEAALPWVYRVATNHCLNVRRNVLRHGEEPLHEATDLPPPLPRSEYPDLDLAMAVLSRFDSQTQALAVGVFVDGMEYDEVAEVLGISRRTVTRKIKRFLENARKFLARNAA